MAERPHPGIEDALRAGDPVRLAVAIESDAAGLRAAGGRPTLARYLGLVPVLGAMPDALDAAIEAELAAGDFPAHGDAPNGVLVRAAALAAAHPAHADAILAAALELAMRGADGIGAADEDDAAGESNRLLAGRWRILERFGSGATASVMLARDELLSRAGAEVLVVVKRLALDAAPDARLHALRELRAHALMPAEVAPAIVAIERTAGAVLVAMRHEPSREASTIGDFAEAARTLARLHAGGLAHGDLKPAHLRVLDDGRVRLVDFGLATAADAASVAGDRRRITAMLERVAGDGPTSRFARAAARRYGAARAGTGAVRLLSPRWRRVFLRRATLAFAGAAAAIALGAAIGWTAVSLLSRPERVHLAAADAFSKALKSTGRLRSLQFDASGRLIGVGLEAPEVLEYAEASELETLRVLEDGGLLFVPYRSPGASSDTGGLPREGLRLAPRGGESSEIPPVSRH